MSEKGNCTAMKLTFLCFDIKLILQEALEDLTYMTGMVRQGMRKNQNVIKVDKNKLVYHVSQDIIDQCLENGRCVN